MIRVILADDHAILRAGIRHLLGLTPDISVVGETADGLATLRLLETMICDVLVLDVSLPTLSGTEVLKRVKADWPHTRVLMLSMHSEEEYAPRLLAADADGYLAKDRSAVELVDAIRRVAGGGIYVTDKAARRIIDSSRSATVVPHQLLSAREHQILILLCEEHTVSEIAAQLDLGISTISTHLGHIKSKLGVSSVAGIVSYAHRAGLAS